MSSSTGERYRPLQNRHGMPSNKSNTASNDSPSSMNESSKYTHDNEMMNSATGPSPNSDLENSSSKRTGFASKTIEELEQDTKAQNRACQSTRVLTLKFNECSAACIAKWAAKRSRPVPDISLSSQRLKVHLASVHATFRVCTICHKVGHYELECLDQSPNEREHFQSCVRLRKKRRLRDSSDFLLEQMNGFLIQQSREGFSAHVVAAAEPIVAEEKAPDNNAEDFVVDGFRIQAYGKKPLATEPSLKHGSIFTWTISQGTGLKTCAGMIISLPDKSSDGVTLKCIDILPHGDPIEGESHDSYMVGKEFQLLKKDLRPIAASFSQIPSLEDGSQRFLTVANALSGENGSHRGRRENAFMEKIRLVKDFITQQGGKIQDFQWGNYESLRTSRPRDPSTLAKYEAGLAYERLLHSMKQRERINKSTPEWQAQLLRDIGIVYKDGRWMRSISSSTE